MRNAYIKVVRDHLMRPALLGAPGAVRIGVPEKWLPWIEERADQVVDELAALGDQVDVVGSLEDLRASPEPVSLAPDEVTDAQLLESALAGLDPAAAGHRGRRRQAHRREGAAAPGPDQRA